MSLMRSSDCLREGATQPISESQFPKLNMRCRRRIWPSGMARHSHWSWQPCCTTSAISCTVWQKTSPSTVWTLVMKKPARRGW